MMFVLDDDGYVIAWSDNTQFADGEELPEPDGHPSDYQWTGDEWELIEDE